jgi:hypothetical protein
MRYWVLLDDPFSHKPLYSTESQLGLKRRKKSAYKALNTFFREQLFYPAVG